MSNNNNTYLRKVSSWQMKISPSYNAKLKLVYIMKAKLAQFGLICKDPVQLEDGTHVFDLDIRGE